MPIVIGLGDTSWNDPLNIYGGKPTAAEPPKSAPATGGGRKFTLSDQDRQDLRKTIAAEAAGEGETGMVAVGNVIRNRAERRGKGLAEVVREPKQFTGYEAPGEGALKILQDPDQLAKIDSIIDRMASGELPDITDGADHYHADYVSPDWAGKMPKTTQVGSHLFYRAESGPDTRRKEMPTYGELAGQIGLDGDPFEAVLKGETAPPSERKPKGRGMADLLPDEPEPMKGNGGVLAFANPGQDKIAPTFRSVLEGASQDLGRGLTVLSGFRAPTHAVEARKKNPGEHSRGTASDISMKGMNEQERKTLVQSLLARGAKRFITYSNSPDMLHVDMKDQQGNGQPWFMHDKSNRNLGRAPGWFQEIAQNPTAAQQAITAQTSATSPTAAPGNTIVIDESFAANDPMGLLAGSNPFAAIADEAKSRRVAEETQVADQFEQNRITGFNQISDREVDAERRELEAANPARKYVTMDAAELPEYQRQWAEENGSTGRGGDFMRNWAAGAGESAQSLDEMGTLLINQIPGGEWVTGSLEKIERWMGDGSTVAEKRAAAIAKADASRTAEGQEAASQTIFKGDSWELGGALTDPDWYLAMIARSAPSMVVSMGPSGLAARGAFTSAIAAGAPEMAAAAAAARVATIGGGITEGILGGAETSAGVARAIAAIPREQLLQSDAVKQLVAEGMSEDEAVRAVTEDAQLQGFITAGVATGLFGGVGDRALAKIIGEGVGGNLGKRIVTGAARNAVAEGVFEELPQSVGQTISQNAAVQRIDPNQSLTEGLAESAVGGLAVGSAMGGGMGAVAGAASPRTGAATDTGEQVSDGYMRVSPEDGSVASPPPSAPEPRGPIGRSVRHAEEQIKQRQAASAPADVIPSPAGVTESLTPAPSANQPERASQDGRPDIGSTVTVSADGIDPFMGTVQGYEGDDAVVFDSSSGEIYQIPLGNLSVNAPPVETIPDRGPQPVNDAIPEFSTDPALEPMAPAAAEVRSEGLPPRSEQKEATERFPSAPTAGQRVIVDDENGGRFVATVQGYENGGNEALIRTDDGKDLQVPVSSLKVSKLTPKQVEAQELERNPPIEREVADAGPTSRSVLGKTIVMPDDKHARLFDLGKERNAQKQLMGTSQLDLDRVNPSEMRALAKEFGVPEKAVGVMAQDYATRMVRNAREANSKLPQRMPPVLEKLLTRLKRDFVDADTSPIADETQSWWDRELDDEGRRLAMISANIKRPSSTTWDGLSLAMQRKLATVRSEQQEAQTAPAADAVDSTEDNSVESEASNEAATELQSVDEAANEAATSPTNDLPEPTEEQKRAGNYRLGHVRLGGLDISIENPAGSERKGTDADGKAWAVEMESHYGYIRATEGTDGDHIDVFVKPGTEALDGDSPVYVVDQENLDGTFDEHKVMLGYGSQKEAEKAYLANYTKGWKLGPVSATTLDGFKSWIADGDTARPYSAVESAAAPDAPAPSVLQPRKDKRPDPEPLVGGSPDFRRLPIPAIPESTPLVSWAKEQLLERGRKTGNEFLLAIDDDGSVVDFGTTDKTDFVGVNAKLARAFANPDRRLVVMHNHPADRPLSKPDLTMLLNPGIYSIWAIGHGGREDRAALTDKARAALAIDGDPADVIAAMDRFDAAMRDAERGLYVAMSAKIEDGSLTLDQASEAHFAAVPEMARRAGLIDFTTNQPYDPSNIPMLDRLMDNAALKLARTLLNERETSPASDARVLRPAVAVQHIGELEGVAENRAVLEGRDKGQGGLSEGGQRYDQAEAQGRKPRRLTGSRRISENSIVEAIKGKWTDLNPSVLATVPLNYFVELARPNMTAVKEYMDVKRLMDAYRGDKHGDADQISQEWLRYKGLGLNRDGKAKAQELADLMHDSTLAGIDPSLTDDETKAKAGYDILRKRYQALPASGKELFAKVRDAYRAQADELDQILLDNVRKSQQIAKDQAEARYRKKLEEIRDAKMNPIDRRKAEEDAASRYKAESTKMDWSAKARLTKLRIQFESSRVPAPYFPLGRFGQYYVTAKDVDGSVISFSKFERAADRDRFAREIQRDYPSAAVTKGVMEDMIDPRAAMDPRMVAEVEQLLGNAGVDQDVMEAVWARYLQSLPELSMRKRYIHRKGTAGFDTDALRVFASHMFHSAHQLAKLKYGLELQELVNTTVDQAKEADDQTRAMRLANELKKRHQWVMRPTGSRLAQYLTSAAFVWHLGLSPAAAALNMAQTVVMGVPVLGARFGGVSSASAALVKASADLVSGKGTIRSANLSQEEAAAVDAFYRTGLVDRTQSHDLAGVGDTGVKYSPLRARVMGVIGHMFHITEVWNREVTALAAYRLARGAGQDHLMAINSAHDLTYKVHFDYTNSNRPRVMQNDFAKVALVFRNYTINTLYRLFRDIHQSVKGESPQARREARYQLAGITGMMALMSGVTGVWGFNLAMAVAGMVFGDDDDPLDFEERFKADMLDVLGPELGGVVLKGVPGHYLGVDLTNRIGMPDLFFRSPGRDLEGAAWYTHYVGEVLGAVAGMGEKMARGLTLVMDGDIARGVEVSSPKFAADVMKSYRYYSEGLQSIKGDELLPADEIGIHGVVAQAMGISPAIVSETWERSGALKNAERRVMDERQRVVNAWAMAALAGDKEGVAEAIERVRKFNMKPVHSAIPITQDTLKRSIKTRVRNAAKREDGVLIQNEILSQRLRAAMPERLY
jgi:hypothetical protein